MGTPLRDRIAKAKPQPPKDDRPTWRRWVEENGKAKDLTAA